MRILFVDYQSLTKNTFSSSHIVQIDQQVGQSGSADDIAREMSDGFPEHSLGSLHVPIFAQNAAEFVSDKWIKRETVPCFPKGIDCVPLAVSGAEHDGIGIPVVRIPWCPLQGFLHQ